MLFKTEPVFREIFRISQSLVYQPSLPALHVQLSSANPAMTD
jgi:hypothetical protein